MIIYQSEYPPGSGTFELRVGTVKFDGPHLDGHTTNILSALLAPSQTPLPPSFYNNEAYYLLDADQPPVVSDSAGGHVRISDGYDTTEEIPVYAEKRSAFSELACLADN